MGKTAAVRPVPVTPAADVVVQRVMNVVVPLRDPSARGKADLVLALARERDALTTALDNVGTVHFARFNIVGDNLEFMSVYDGLAASYLLEFALQVGAAFDAIVSRAADWPPPPFRPDDEVSVTQCPSQFVEWVLAHELPHVPRDVTDLLYESVRGDLRGRPLEGVLRDRLVALFEDHGGAHFSMQRGYAGASCAQIRDALGLGW
jgi:hypothetical protein